MAEDKIAEFLTKSEWKNARICKTYCNAQQLTFTYIYTFGGISKKPCKEMSQYKNVLKKVYKRVHELVNSTYHYFEF